MKRLFLMLAIIGLPTVASAITSGQQLHDYLTIYSNVLWANGYASGYIDGTIDAALGCPGEHLTHAQAWQLVKNYLEAHPEKWNKDAPILIKEALQSICKYGETN
jgi:Rap1a immunity proteins